MDILGAGAIQVEPGSTSYFSTPSHELDPHLFAGMRLQSWAREGILGILFDYLAQHYSNPHLWTHVWLAGSGVSYQWQAARIPSDLDCLVGIDYPSFRQHNQDFNGMSDTEISKMLNENFTKDLMPNTVNWYGYELTFYVNPGATDIRSINPYAAYNLENDEWTVEPSQSTGVPYSRAWAVQAQRDHETATNIVFRYTNALNNVQNASNPAYRLNAEVQLKQTVDAGASLFEQIHSGRKTAFSRTGAGYADFNNYRWQAGKASGAIHALRMLKDYKDAVGFSNESQTYGVELPDANTLIRRAAMRRARI